MTARRGVPATLAALLLVGGVALAGCSDRVGGSGRVAAGRPSAGASAPPDSPRSTPSAPPSVPSSAAGPDVPVVVAVIESHRLGAYAVDPHRVAPKADTASCLPPAPSPTPGAANVAIGSLDNSSKAALTKAGYSGGWFNCFSLGKDAGGVVGLAETVDPSGAQALSSYLALGAVHPGAKPATLPGFAQATVVQFTSFGKTTMLAMVPVGRLLAYVYDDAPGVTAGALPGLRAQVARLLTLQLARAKTFRPTPVARWGTLNADPELLDGRIYQPAGDPSWYSGGWSLESFPAIATSPAVEIPALRANGFTEYYRKDGDGAVNRNHKTIFYTQAVAAFALRDAAAARRVLTIEAPTLEKGLPHRAFTLPNSPGTACVYRTQKIVDQTTYAQHCLLTAGRYVLEFFNDTAITPTDYASLQLLIRRQLHLTPR